MADVHSLIRHFVHYLHHPDIKKNKNSNINYAISNSFLKVTSERALQIFKLHNTCFKE